MVFALAVAGVAVFARRDAALCSLLLGSVR